MKSGNIIFRQRNVAYNAKEYADLVLRYPNHVVDPVFRLDEADHAIIREILQEDKASDEV